MCLWDPQHCKAIWPDHANNIFQWLHLKMMVCHKFIHLFKLRIIWWVPSFLGLKKVVDRNSSSSCEDFKRTSVQKSNKNEIFMAGVKNSNCLNFCIQVDPIKTRKAVYFFPQICFYFLEKRTFRFHPLESMDRVITGRKLNTFARFAFQRYYV